MPRKFAPEEFASSPFALSIFPGQAFGGECNRKQPTFCSLLKCNLIGMNLTLAESVFTWQILRTLIHAWKRRDQLQWKFVVFGDQPNNQKNKVWSRIFMHLAVEIDKLDAKFDQMFLNFLLSLLFPCEDLRSSPAFIVFLQETAFFCGSRQLLRKHRVSVGFAARWPPWVCLEAKINTIPRGRRKPLDGCHGKEGKCWDRQRFVDKWVIYKPKEYPRL